MRIFGELQTVDEDQPALGYSLCATAILSMADVTETSFFPQREQDARLSPQLMRKIGIFGARYSHRPTGDGLIAVMRLIPDDGDKVPTFKQLGFIPEQIRLLNVMLRRPEGKIVLSGPTGSGKSTTLRSACRVYLDDNQGRHLLTIEDPLEGQILGQHKLRLSVTNPTKRPSNWHGVVLFHRQCDLIPMPSWKGKCAILSR